MESKFKIGDKVVPISKSTGVVTLNECEHWSLARNINQNYLFVVGLGTIENEYICNYIKTKMPTGSRYLDSDLVFYENASMDTSTTKKEMTVLEEAQSLIYGDREKDYGSASKNFENISKMWSVILGKEISTEEVIQCMIALKQCRLINQPGHKDSWVDICGYVGVWDKIQKNL